MSSFITVVYRVVNIWIFEDVYKCFDGLCQEICLWSNCHIIDTLGTSMFIENFRKLNADLIYVSSHIHLLRIVAKWF